MLQNHRPAPQSPTYQGWPHLRHTMYFFLPSFSARASKIYKIGGIMNTYGHFPPKSELEQTAPLNNFLRFLYFSSLFNLRRGEENSLPKVPRHTPQLLVTFRKKCIFSAFPNQLNPFFYKQKTRFQTWGRSLLNHGLRLVKLYFYVLKNGRWAG